MFKAARQTSILAWRMRLRAHIIYMKNTDTNRIDNAWTAFSTSGRVEDYIRFTSLRAAPASSEESTDADSDRGTDYPVKEYR